MHIKRVGYFVFATVIILFLLLGRVLYLQTNLRSVLANGALDAQAVDVPLNPSLGDIFDRNGICLTRNYDACVAVVFPTEIIDRVRTIDAIARLSGIGVQEVENKFDKGVMCYFTLKTSKEKAEASGDLDGVRLFEGYRRYNSDNLACHLIGYVDSGLKGTFGLERAFGEELFGGKVRYARFFTDAGRHKPFDNAEKIVTISEDKGIALTIDYRIQKDAEQALDGCGLKGAVIVTDVTNAEVLGICSTPKFNQSEIARYISSKNGELVDRTAMAYEPGSIFKLVLTASALENGLDPYQLRFNCTGSQQIGDVVIGCHKHEGHGEQDLVRALANSCNPAFIQLGTMLGGDKIALMANKLGFGKSLSIYEGQGSSLGNIPLKSEYLPVEVANMSIGQGNIQATPLQVAELIDIIANGGKKRKLNVVKGITGARGEVVKTIESFSEEQVIAPTTATQIGKMMHEVTVNGTASNGNLEKIGGGAAKTGTAQSGWLAPDGTLMMHAWFAGFFPMEKPRYCITVFVENGRQGNAVAGAIYKRIAEKINKYSY